MTLRVNQATQFYVANVFETSNAITKKSKPGSIKLKGIKSVSGVEDAFVFEYKGADSTMTSDIVDLKKIICATVSKADKDARKIKEVVLKLDPSVNGGKPIAGQDYIVNIEFTQYIGMSDEDIYIKFGAVRGVKDMTAADFYQKLATSLWMNFSKEWGALLDFTLNGKKVEGTKVVNGVKVPVDKDGAVIEGSDDGITITEAEQEWVLGVKAQVPVNFTVKPSTITAGGEDVTWGVVEAAATPKTQKNGKRVADMEYFHMGERNGVTRNVGWPDVIPVTYLVDPAKEYDLINIHYYYEGPSGGVQKGEKDIMIACVHTESDSVADSIVAALAAKGVSIKK